MSSENEAQSTSTSSTSPAGRREPKPGDVVVKLGKATAVASSRIPKRSLARAAGPSIEQMLAEHVGKGLRVDCDDGEWRFTATEED